MRIIIICIILLIGINNSLGQVKKPFNRFKDSINRFYGLIDTSGKIIIKPRYSILFPVYGCDNLFEVQINKKSGIINLNEDFVIPPVYDWIASYGNIDTIFRVTINYPEAYKVKGWTQVLCYTQGLSGYININNDTIIPLIYPHIGEFINSEQVTEFTFGKFSVRLARKYYGFKNPFVGKKWGLIDRKGNVVLKDDFYDFIFNMHSQNNLFFAYKGKKNTILNLRGEQLIPLKRRTHEQLYKEYDQRAFF